LESTDEEPFRFGRFCSKSSVLLFPDGQIEVGDGVEEWRRLFGEEPVKLAAAGEHPSQRIDTAMGVFKGKPQISRCRRAQVTPEFRFGNIKAAKLDLFLATDVNLGQD
jgi:hypothetical protein